jgi:hypothetical protein
VLTAIRNIANNASAASAAGRRQLAGAASRVTPIRTSAAGRAAATYGASTGHS